jgi:hypothetical protein
MEEEKLQAVRDYLQEHFPSAHHADQPTEDLDQIFRVTTEDDIIRLVVVKKKVLKNHTKTQLAVFFDLHNLIEVMKSMKSGQRIVVKMDGLLLESVINN